MEREQSWRGASTGLGWRGGESSVLFLLPDGWNLHSQPPSIYQRLWWCCRGTGTQSRRGAHLSHHPRWHCGVREKHNPLFFQPLCCCIALLQQFSLTIMVCFLLIVLLWGVLFLTFHGPLSDQWVQADYLIPQQYLLKVKWKSLSRVRLFVTPWTIQSMEFSKPERWSSG